MTGPSTNLSNQRGFRSPFWLLPLWLLCLRWSDATTLSSLASSSIISSSSASSLRAAEITWVVVEEEKEEASTVTAGMAAGVGVYMAARDEAWFFASADAAFVYRFETKERSKVEIVSQGGRLPSLGTRTAAGWSPSPGGVVAIMDRFYAFGGQYSEAESFAWSSDVHSLDPSEASTTGWTLVEPRGGGGGPRPQGRPFIGAVVAHGANMYIYSSFPGAPADLWVFDTVTSQWTQKTSPPAAASSMVRGTKGTAASNFLLFYSYLENTVDSPQLSRYDPAKDKWLALQPPAEGRTTRTTLEGRSAAASSLALSGRDDVLLFDDPGLALFIVDDAGYARVNFEDDTLSNHHIQYLSSRKRCNSSIILHSPTNTPYCVMDGDMVEMRLKCHYEEGCPPFVPSSTCPAYKPYRCPSMLCVADLRECQGLIKSCGGSHLCSNGDCVTSCYSCNVEERMVLPCAAGMIRCCDGSCRHGLEQCLSHHCSWPAPFRCLSDQCAASSEDCAASASCGPGMELCEDGVCRELSQCPAVSIEMCPLSSTLCPDLSCAPQGTECNVFPSYCGKNKVKCWDGSCIPNDRLCPHPSLAIQTTPYSVTAYDFPTKSLPLVDWETGEVMGGVRLNTSNQTSGVEVSVSKADLSAVRQAIFGGSKENMHHILGPCFQVFSSSYNEVDASVEMELTTNIAKHLRANEVHMVLMNNSQQWQRIPTTTDRASSQTDPETTTVSIFASSPDAFGTYCVAYFGDTRIAVSVKVSGPSVIVLSKPTTVTISLHLSAAVWDDVVLPFSIGGTAVNQQDYFLISSPSSLAPNDGTPTSDTSSSFFFKAGTSSSSPHTILFPALKEFKGYRTLELLLTEEAMPSQLFISPKARNTTIRLTKELQSIVTPRMKVIFSTDSLLHRLVPLHGTGREEQPQLELAVKIVGVAEVNRDGKVVVYHTFTHSHSFNTESIQPRSLVLSTTHFSLGESGKNTSLRAAFKVSSTVSSYSYLFLLTPSSSVPQTLALDTLSMDVEMKRWKFHASTAWLEVITHLTSNDGPLKVILQEEDEDEGEQEDDERVPHGSTKSLASPVFRLSTTNTTFTFQTRSDDGIQEEQVPRFSELNDEGNENGLKVVVWIPLFTSTATTNKKIRYSTDISLQTLLALSKDDSDFLDGGGRDTEDEEYQKNKRIIMSVSLSVLGMALLLAGAGALLLFAWRRVKQKFSIMIIDKETASSDMELGPLLAEGTSSTEEEEEEMQIECKMLLHSDGKKGKADNRDKPTASCAQSAICLEFDEIEIGARIGQGSFGVVHVGTWQWTDVAIKLIDTIRPELLEDFAREAEVMQRLPPHPNVVLLFGVCMDAEHPLCIVTEFLPNGSLLDHLHDIKKKGARMEHGDMMRIAKGIAAGMMHLHAERILHCDLAARNVLLTGNLEAKVSDFGMARVLREGQAQHQTNSNEGPVRWMAPESLKERVYSEKTDAWSFGVVLWEIATAGKVPFADKSNAQVCVEVLSQGLRLEAPADAPLVFRHLMEACFRENAKERPNFAMMFEMLKQARKEVKRKFTSSF
ncbi:CLL4A clavata1-like receptor S/T protein kinase protein [Balamuthia mandrillaris]